MRAFEREFRYTYYAVRCECEIVLPPWPNCRARGRSPVCLTARAVASRIGG